MGCYLSGLKIIICKYLFIYLKKKQYVELRSENIGVYCHWPFLFIIIYLLSWTCKSSKSSKRFPFFLLFILFFEYIFIFIFIYLFIIFFRLCCFNL